MAGTNEDIAGFQIPMQPSGAMEGLKAGKDLGKVAKTLSEREGSAADDAVQIVFVVREKEGNVVRARRIDADEGGDVGSKAVGCSVGVDFAVGGRPMG